MQTGLPNRRLGLSDSRVPLILGNGQRRQYSERAIEDWKVHRRSRAERIGNGTEKLVGHDEHRQRGWDDKRS